MHRLDDTIVAIATAPGGAARGIVRASGPLVSQLVAACFLADPPADVTATRRATVFRGATRLNAWHAAAPCLLYLWPTVRSYTRQPLAEFHVIGSPPLLDALLATCCDAGARLAAPGEFTLRAFLAGRLDLTQAEAVLGVIDAVDRGQLETALAQLAGGLAQPFAALRSTLLEVLAQLEAGLDFAEEDIEFITRDQLLVHLSRAARQVAQLRQRIDLRGSSRHEFRAALVGPPNAGKSSLFNALTRGQAIVSDIPGTTRDFLTARLDVEGQSILLIDTAGIVDRPPPPGHGERRENTIDRLAADATDATRSTADLEIICIDSQATADATTRSTVEAAESTTAGGESIRPRRDTALPSARGFAPPTGFASSHTTPPTRLRVWTKCDLPHADGAYPSDAIRTSSRTGQGLDELRKRLAQAARAHGSAESAVVAATAARCQDALARASTALEQACCLTTENAGDEFIAAELRLALDELGQIVGAVYTDDILDRVFSRFCIGK